MRCLPCWRPGATVGYMQPAPSVLDPPPSQPRIDRRGQDRQHPGWLAQIWQDSDTRVLPVDNAKAPVSPTQPTPTSPTLTSSAASSSTAVSSTEAVSAPTLRLDLQRPKGHLPDHAVYLGQIALEQAFPEDVVVSTEHQGRHVIAVPARGEAEGSAAVTAASTDRQQQQWADLRRVGSELPAVDAELLTEATAVLAWHDRSQFCPRCGQATEIRNSGWMRLCSGCHAEDFPRTDPAVITAVVDPDDRLLLGSATRWEAARFSTFAGFVEAGESLEDAVVREVAEESGVTVETVEYLGSQSWPFPRSLMLGFIAHTGSAEAYADEGEIREVRWFTRDQLHAQSTAGDVILPPRSSISRALIEHWYGGRLD